MIFVKHCNKSIIKILFDFTKPQQKAMKKYLTFQNTLLADRYDYDPSYLR